MRLANTKLFADEAEALEELLQHVLAVAGRRRGPPTRSRL